MSLNASPTITWKIPEHGVAVWISAILKDEHGCDVADVEGFALSHPDSAELMAVCLAGPRDPSTGKHIIGPEYSAPWPNTGYSRNPLTKILSELLWAEARKTETRHRLQDAWEEAQAEASSVRAGNRYDHQRNMRGDAA